MQPLPETVDLEFDELTLRFNDPKLEAEFVDEHNRRAMRPLRAMICIFAAIILLQAAVGFYGAYEENWARYEHWLNAAPHRLATLSLLGLALWMTTLPTMFKHAQVLIALVVAGLYLAFILAADSFGHWILLTTAKFNFSISLLAVSAGLLFRYSAPIACVLALGYTPILANWLDNPVAPIFLVLATACVMSWVARAIERARRNAWVGAKALAEEKALTERLLLSVLPPSIAKRMRGGETLIADSHREATVVFADIVNFTPLSASMPPEALVEILDDIFAAFDEIADEYDLEKIKTIGDAYMMAAGLPTERSADPSHALDAALAMRERLAEIAASRDIEIFMRAGVHIGPVVAGVIGRSKFVYDLWGDSVNVASRMESTAPAGEIQVTQAVRDQLSDAFDFTPRGDVEVKGMGSMTTWLLQGRRDCETTTTEPIVAVEAAERREAGRLIA